jgi:hypothetical protein
VSHAGRLLTGCSVNLSISESDDSNRLGHPSWQVNRTTLQIVAALFGQGASVVFGHDWRDDGVMQAVYGFAQQVQAPIPLPRGEAVREGQPLLRNMLPWPDQPFLASVDLDRLSPTLCVQSAGLPADLRDYERRASSDGRVYKYLRARALTHLRRELNRASTARLCLGGRLTGFAGRYPGIVEEAYLAVSAGKPLFVSSLLGGAAHWIVRALERQEKSDELPVNSEVDSLYRDPPVPNRGGEDCVINSRLVWEALAARGPDGLRNGLTHEQNLELFHTPVVERVIELMLIGLSHVQRHE